MPVGEEIVREGRRLTDAPDLYLEAVKYWILSSTLGRFTIVPFFPRPPDNPLRPNVWVVISGAPGIMRKSTVIEGLGRYMVRQAWAVYLQQVMSRLDAKALRELLAKMFIETGSYEGIAKHISEAQEDLDTFFIVSAEWGGILKLTRSREYMTGFATLLSKLYSGEELIARYAKETRYIRGGLYVTALLGMQEPWLYLDNIVFRQGLMRRVIFVYQEPADKTRWLPPLDLGRGQVLENLAIIAEGLGSKMALLRRAEPVVANLSSGAVKAINDYARSLEEELRREGASNWNLYAQNLWEHVTKLAVLEALDRQEPRESNIGHYIIVNEDDVARAMSFITRTIPRAREALSRAGAGVREVEVRTVESAQEIILSVLKRHGCLRTRDLMLKTRIAKADLKPLVLELVETGRLHAYMTQGGRGRPSVYICTPDAGVRLVSRRPGLIGLDARVLESVW